MSTSREENIKTIELFLGLNGRDRAEKAKALFTPSAVYQTGSDIGETPRAMPVSQWLEESAQKYPERGFYKPELYQCDDEDRFIVRSIMLSRTPDEENSAMLSELRMEGIYLSFEMENGKIKVVREADNRCELWPRRYIRTYDMSPEEAARQRAMNLETLKYLITLSGPDRNLKRRPHFAADGVFQLKIHHPMSTNEWLDYVAEDIPEWGYYSPVIFQTENPCKFIVETYVVGKALDIDNDRTMLKDSIMGAMIVLFEMYDGKVKLFREAPLESMIAPKPL